MFYLIYLLFWFSPHYRNTSFPASSPNKISCSYNYPAIYQLWCMNINYIIIINFILRIRSICLNLELYSNQNNVCFVTQKIDLIHLQFIYNLWKICLIKMLLCNSCLSIVNFAILFRINIPQF